MHWTALLAKRYIPPDSQVVGDVHCIDCGYNLRGLRAAGACPECGRLIGDSLFILAKPDEVASGLRTFARGYWAMAGVLLSCLIAASWGLMVVVGILLMGSIWRAIGLAQLEWHGAIRRLPVIGTRLDVLWWMVLADLIITAVWLVCIVMTLVIPTLSTSSIMILRNWPAMAWLTVIFVKIGVFGWFARAMAELLGYQWMVIEAKLQTWAVVLTALLLVPIVILQAVNTNRTAEMIITLGYGAIMLAVIAFTSVLAIHIANASETEFDTMDDLIDGGRIRVTPREPGEYHDTEPPIPIQPLPKQP